MLLEYLVLSSETWTWSHIATPTQKVKVWETKPGHVVLQLFHLCNVTTVVKIIQRHREPSIAGDQDHHLLWSCYTWKRHNQDHHQDCKAAKGEQGSSFETSLVCWDVQAMLFNFLLQGQLKWITERRIDEREKERESEHRKIPPNAQLMTPHSPPCPRPPSHQEYFCKAERNTLTSSQPFWFHSVVNLLQLRQHCDKESWQCYQMCRHIKETIIVQIH